MPIRPDDPNDGTALVNQILARLRALERTRAALPDSANPLQTFENGSPLGDTRFLDFGPGVLATLIGDDYVYVTGSSGGLSPWDAIVDSSIAATDTSTTPPIFKTSPGEAMTYLSSIGLTHANIFIRNGDYTEVSNWDQPVSTVLFGTETGRASQFATSGQVVWRISNKAANSATGRNIVTMNMTVRASSTSVSGALGKSWWGINCVVHSQDSVPVGYYYVSDFVILESCMLNVMPKLGGISAGTSVHLNDCDIEMDGKLVTLADRFVAENCNLQGNGDQWTVGATMASIDVRAEQILGGSGGITASLAIAGSDSAGTKELYINSDGALSTINLTGTLWETVIIRGLTGAVTVPRCANMLSLEVTGSSTNVDVTGPGYIDIQANKLTVRGRGINGSFVSTRSGGAGGTALDYIGATHSNIQASIGVLPGAGTTKSYNFDAASSDNLLLWNDHAEYPTAGTNSGTNNRILPEGSSPPPAGGIAPADADYLVGTANAGLSAEIVVGTTPGGELSGTWAAPTVDATHSGSAHADFVPVAGHVNGHVIEDEGTPLTQRANLNFAGAGVTVTDDTPDTKVTIPGVGTPTAGWGSITNVTVDRAYDADATTLDEVADVLGQLVADLIAQGVLDT